MRWLVAAWVGATLLATAVLGVVGAQAGALPEWGHLVGHVGLCGVFAGLVSGAVRGTPERRAGLGLAGAVVFGAAIEVVQLRYAPTVGAVAFDLAVDTVAGAAGAIASALLRGERTDGIGHLLSVVFHPLWVAPVGLCSVVCTSAALSVTGALAWTVVGAACLSPAVAVWAVGLGRWWTDADVSRRTDRPRLFALGIAGLAVLVGLSWAAPEPLVRLALGLVAGAVLGTGLTLAGCKVSGHVAIPAMLGLATVEWWVEGALPLLGVAAVLSWARIAAGRHHATEVGAAWVLAGVAAGVVAGLGALWS